MDEWLLLISGTLKFLTSDLWICNTKFDNEADMCWLVLCITDKK
jgi:hypothetical protein